MKNITIKPLLILLLLLAAFSTHAQNSAAKDEIIKGMNDAALDWNKGNLDGYMALYDSTATMMTKSGRIGLDGIRAVYVKYYFDGNVPKQELSYDNYQLTFLGPDYALLTGSFMLKANAKLPQRTGIYSLIFVHRNNGWKLLHDHSG
jgi:ketosteroid isomerase-like protein